MIRPERKVSACARGIASRVRCAVPARLVRFGLSHSLARTRVRCVKTHFQPEMPFPFFVKNLPNIICPTFLTAAFLSGDILIANHCYQYPLYCQKRRFFLRLLAHSKTHAGHRRTYMPYSLHHLCNVLRGILRILAVALIPCSVINSKA